MKKKIILLAVVIFVMLSLLAISRSSIFVETNACVGCGDCIDVCPIEGAITLIDGKAIIDADKCILCEICIRSCTYDAIRKDK